MSNENRTPHYVLESAEVSHWHLGLVSQAATYHHIPSSLPQQAISTACPGRLRISQSRIMLPPTMVQTTLFMDSTMTICGTTHHHLRYYAFAHMCIFICLPC